MSRVFVLRDSLVDELIVIHGFIAQPSVLDSIPPEELVSLEVVKATGSRESLVLMIDRCGLETPGVQLSGRRFVTRSASCPWAPRAPRAAP